MSRAAEAEIEFAGETRLVRLRIGQLRALQEKCDAGPMELFNRMGAGNWRIDDVRETIVQGLIGGGMEVFAASSLMKNHFDDLPKIQFVGVARFILLAALSGVEDEPLGEQKAGEAKPKRRSRGTKSASDHS